MLRERFHYPGESANRPPVKYLPGSPAPVVPWLPPCGWVPVAVSREEEKQVQFKRKAVALAAGLASVAAGVIALVPTAAQAVPATIPLVFQNSSGRGDPVYIYNLGTELSSGRQGWADA